MNFTLRVYGTPAPQGSKRYVGKGIMVESSKNVKPWREAVKWSALEKIMGKDFERFEGALRLHLAFFLKKPKSAPRKRKWPEVKPDVDKLARSTMDALKDAGIYRDDSQVCSLHAFKEYDTPHEAPGAEIIISELE